MLTEDGALTISGTGAMWDFSLNSSPGWARYSANISAVVIESGATTVGSYAFVTSAGYPNLASVSIPATVESIGERAFYNCSALAEVTLSAGLQELGKNAFAGTALVVLTIPGTVTAISASAFANCSALHRMSFLGDAPSIESNAFKNVTATAYYPANDASWTKDVRQDYGGSITWVSYEPEPDHIPGDINGDGNVTNKDVTALQRWIKYKDVPIY